MHRVQITYAPANKYQPPMTHYVCSCGTWNYRHREFIYSTWQLEEIVDHFEKVEGIKVDEGMERCTHRRCADVPVHRRVAPSAETAQESAYDRFRRLGFPMVDPDLSAPAEQDEEAERG